MNLSTRFVDKTKNFFALGLMYWMYNRPLDQSIRFIQEKFGGKDPQVAEANLRVLKAGTTTATPPKSSPPATTSSPRSCPREDTGTSWGTSPPPSDWSPQRRKPGSSSSSAAIPITPASDILHELSKLQGVRREDVPGGGRNRGDLLGHRRLLCRRTRRHDHQRPGPRAEDRSARSRRHARTPARRRQRPARRTEHRTPDQDRTGGSPAGRRRPERRSPALRHRGLDAGRLLHHRVRSCAASPSSS